MVVIFLKNFYQLQMHTAVFTEKKLAGYKRFAFKISEVKQNINVRKKDKNDMSKMLIF